MQRFRSEKARIARKREEAQRELNAKRKSVSANASARPRRPEPHEVVSLGNSSATIPCQMPTRGFRRPHVWRRMIVASSCMTSCRPHLSAPCRSLLPSVVRPREGLAVSSPSPAGASYLSSMLRVSRGLSLSLTFSPPCMDLCSAKKKIADPICGAIGSRMCGLPSC